MLKISAIEFQQTRVKISSLLEGKKELIMGSLMAGWSSPRKDIRSEKLQRNKSLTKEEIESYWKSKKRTEEDHLSAIAEVRNEKRNINGGLADRFQRSISFPFADRKMNYGDANIFTDELKKSNCWWTRSNWAFLNEPPVTAMEGPSYKYAGQYHFADLADQKL